MALRYRAAAALAVWSGALIAGRLTATLLMRALCTGDIALFKIVSEQGVAAGVRRIEAVAGNAAEEHVRHQIDLLNQAAAVMKVRPEDLPSRLQALVDGQRRIELELSDAKKALALAGGGSSGGTTAASDEVREIVALDGTQKEIAPMDIGAIVNPN